MTVNRYFVEFYYVFVIDAINCIVRSRHIDGTFTMALVTYLLNIIVPCQDKTGSCNFKVKRILQS